MKKAGVFWEYAVVMLAIAALCAFLMLLLGCQVHMHFVSEPEGIPPPPRYSSEFNSGIYRDMERF